MPDRTLLRTGLTGSVIAAICCFTPLLVVLVAGVGLSAIVGYLDYALFPILFAFLGVTAYALYLNAGNAGPQPRTFIVAAVIALSALIIWLEFRYALRISIAVAAAVAAYAYYLRKSPARSLGRQTES